ncbi:hypothetical protein MHPYR_470036 [uncultured Mycobacterium sp.]|uniref:Uncharacterized protein n=1 Tax=uncultured Mycobacterium sp. TaxID=171292 RepID=A0A1Y5PG90_9MYCO|nr:hypothetical protein MHPYR_470036 [uncultured Mycobacterium sp.]
MSYTLPVREISRPSKECRSPAEGPAKATVQRETSSGSKSPQLLALIPITKVFGTEKGQATCLVLSLMIGTSLS